MQSIVIIPCVRLTPRLEDAIESALSQDDLATTIAVVVDGGGSALHEERDDNVIVVGTERQRGFAAACNEGVRHTLSGTAPDDVLAQTVIIFLNDDATLPDSWTDDIELLGDSEVGALGWKVRGPNGDRKSYPSEPWQRHAENADAERAVRHIGPTLAGSAFAVRADHWKLAGGMDERYGMYGEETDLFLTLQAAGLNLIEVQHHSWHEGEGSMSHHKIRSSWYGIRNPVWVAIIHYSPSVIARTILVTFADALSIRRLSPSAEPHRRRRRATSWPMRLCCLLLATLSTLAHLPKLLAGRRHRNTVRRSRAVSAS